MRWRARHRGLGLEGPVDCVLPCRLKRAMPLEQAQGVIQITIFLMPALYGARPKGAFLGIGVGHCLDHWQSQLALAKIVAHVLAGGG